MLAGDTTERTLIVFVLPVFTLLMNLISLLGYVRAFPSSALSLKTST